MEHIWGRRRKHVRFWWECQKERDYLEDLDVDGRIILKQTFEKHDAVVVFIHLA
jgi:hypothetical protein